jgi:FAD synthetase
LAQIKKNPLVKRAVLGAEKDYLGHILRLKPDIIALGYDQKAYTQGLKRKLLAKGLKVKIRRLKPYKPDIHKSTLYKRHAADG